MWVPSVAVLLGVHSLLAEAHFPEHMVGKAGGGAGGDGERVAQLRRHLAHAGNTELDHDLAGNVGDQIFNLVGFESLRRADHAGFSLRHTGMVQANESTLTLGEDSSVVRRYPNRSQPYSGMIIHASKAFEKRFKCEVSGEGHVVLQSGRLDSWSGHVVRIGPISYILFMNDATLYALIIPSKGLTTFAALLKVLLPVISDLWAKHGGSFDPDNQSVIVLPRTNRSLIGSMNWFARRCANKCCTCTGT